MAYYYDDVGIVIQVGDLVKYPQSNGVTVRGRIVNLPDLGLAVRFETPDSESGDYIRLADMADSKGRTPLKFLI